MKSLKCDFCEEEIQGENFDQWMQGAHAHYGSKHGDKIANVSEEGKQKWVAEAKQKFEAA